MTQRRRGKRGMGVWLGLLALAIQAVLPLLLAVEIRALTRDPLLAASLDPSLLCTHDGPAPAGGLPAHHDMAVCPICTALAAGQAIPTPAAVMLPLRSETVIAELRPAAALRPLHAVYFSYEARGPPLFG